MLYQNTCLHWLSSTNESLLPQHLAVFSLSTVVPPLEYTPRRAIPVGQYDHPPETPIVFCQSVIKHGSFSTFFVMICRSMIS